MKKIYSLLFLFLTVAVPQSAFAFSCPRAEVLPPQSFSDVVCFADSTMNSLLPIIIGASLLTTFFGLIKLIKADNNSISEGKEIMLWGIIGLFVMLSFIGILNLFTHDFFGTNAAVPQFPES